LIKDIVKYTTIVRTNFPEFEDVNKCHEDRINMINENEKLSEIVQKCRIIYVDNPPLVGRPGIVKENKQCREESRTRILLHLSLCNEIYLPKNLKDLNKNIDSYMTEAEIFQKQINDLNEKLKEKTNLNKELEAKLQRELKDAKNRIDSLNTQVGELTRQHVPIPVKKKKRNL
jgi:hypothetical protein